MVTTARHALIREEENWSFPFPLMVSLEGLPAPYMVYNCTSTKILEFRYRGKIFYPSNRFMIKLVGYVGRRLNQN